MSSSAQRRSILSLAIRSVLTGSAAALSLAGPGVASAQSQIAGDELDALKQQVQVLMERIEQLEQRQEQMQAEQDVLEHQVEETADSAVTEGVVPGSFRIPGINTSVEVSGYVKLDAIYDVDQDLGDSFAFSSILPNSDPDKQNFDGHTRLHGRQSRLRVRTHSDVGAGKAITSLLEGDFYGDGGNESFSNSSSFRIRHAFATFGIPGRAAPVRDEGWLRGVQASKGTHELLLGQTWTNFMDVVAFPTTVDFHGPAGISFVSQGQIRWTLPNGLSFSLENPETDGTGAAGRLGESRGGIGEDELPDAVVAWRGGPRGRGGSYEVSGLLRRLGVNGVAPEGSQLAGTRLDANETGWGINLAGNWVFGRAMLMASVVGGDGIGRYIQEGFANDLFVNADGTVDTVKSAGSVMGIQFHWNDTSHSLLALGHFRNADPEMSNGIDRINSAHLSYWWTPWPAANFGFELIYGDLKNAAGEYGDNTRFQFGAQRNF